MVPETLRNTSQMSMVQGNIKPMYSAGVLVDNRNVEGKKQILEVSCITASVV